MKWHCMNFKLLPIVHCRVDTLLKSPNMIKYDLHMKAIAEVIQNSIKIPPPILPPTIPEVRSSVTWSFGSTGVQWSAMVFFAIAIRRAITTNITRNRGKRTLQSWITNKCSELKKKIKKKRWSAKSWTIIKINMVNQNKDDFQNKNKANMVHFQKNEENDGTSKELTNKVHKDTAFLSRFENKNWCTCYEKIRFLWHTRGKCETQELGNPSKAQEMRQLECEKWYKV